MPPPSQFIVCILNYLQGVPKKMRLGFCLISRQPNIGFSNRFFLLETEIHTPILNTKPFLYDLRRPRYLQNKMGFVTEVIEFNLHFCYFHLSGILKDDKNKYKLKRIYPVLTTYDILGYFGGFQCQSGASKWSVC